ncbi:CitMHS family transporter [Sphingobium yanoikuyae]|jgi:CitMHS family citrate-Mg2+:H+ or citrate-Ca2+:H+ symporter|uniref:CitMHS family transporter n=1 Tax=Sphingobium yanoikuyae TaxID=13690 RepID=A0A291N1N0_SPHYA|nr:MULTISPECIES: CitMHS family transporter [Sphingobium]ATI81253.1 citrate transporter [Sphingobium yanoikuyae]MBT2242092.1 CitMHS family transporter [Sphingobium sp. BHU LFT2]MDH2131527.1 CitMHS family transporter [Sphingobium yanoikuyae]MDH2152147.1 CitMHS family transporter [Sphingobium yanoikuyae]MDH2167209.1 CitMHS family transporter [Sphingobium yanoikuyae]
MNLALLGFLMVATFMTLIMTKRMTPLVALIVIPSLFGVIAGQAAGLGDMMIDGIKNLAPTGVMLLFAILFFSTMTDTGLFDPLVARLVKIVHGDPLLILLGTVVLCSVVSLDGDGSTTYIITIAALLPLYKRFDMNRLYLVCLLMVTSGIMNLTPWGGPTARAASALKLDPATLFLPLIPGMIAGLAFLLGLAFWFGIKERRRLGKVQARQSVAPSDLGVSQYPEARRPHLRWFNGLLVVALLVLLVWGVLPLSVLMMIAFAIAMIVNYPGVAQQKERIAAHAGNVLSVVSLIFAAGIFTGILGGTGMVEAMSKEVVGVIPPALGPYMAPITALLSMPFTFFISNDAFYFGMLPILAEAGAHYGVEPMAIARASLMGQPVHLLSPLVPSTYLLVSLAGVDLADHQRFTLLPAAAVGIVMTLVGMIALAFPFVA